MLSLPSLSLRDDDLVNTYGDSISYEARTTYIAEQLAGLACFGAEQHRDDGFRLGGVLVHHVHLCVKASPNRPAPSFQHAATAHR